MRDHQSLIKKGVVLISSLIGVFWFGHELFYVIPQKMRTVMLQNSINMFGHQLGWLSGRILLRKIYQNSKTEWPLYGVLYFILPLWAFVVSKNQMLQSLGLGRSVAGFASIGVWILMERLLEVRAKPKQWSRYFSFYIVFYHLSGLLTQATFGTSLFAYRHAWASMVAFLLLTTVLPSFLLWSEGVEIERISLFKQFFNQNSASYFHFLNRFGSYYKKIFLPPQHSVFRGKARSVQWSLWGKKFVNWRHFNGVVIGVAGVFLGCLSAAYPIYFRIERTACLFPMPFSIGLVLLILGNVLGFIIHPFLLRFSALWRLKIDLIGIALSVCLFLKIRAMYAFSLNLIFLGSVCHMLYPDLIARMQQWSLMKPLTEVRLKIENCLQYANYVFLVVSCIDRVISPTLLSGAKTSIDDFLYYFLNGYLFLFCFALIPDEADHFVAERKQKIKGWIKTKQKSVTSKVLEEIETIKPVKKIQGKMGAFKIVKNFFKRKN